MFKKIFDNFGDGVARFMGGARPEEAFEQAVMGEVSSDYEIQTKNPIITNSDFFNLLDDIGLGFLNDSVKAGEFKKYILGEENSPQQICVGVQAHKTRPHAEIVIEGRMMETRIVIRQNLDTELYQIDDAYIADIVDGFVEPNWIIITDEYDAAPNILKEFLTVFSTFAKEIYNAPDENSPTEIEVRLSKALKPIQAEVADYELNRYQQYQQEIAKMVKPDPLAPR